MRTYSALRVNCVLALIATLLLTTTVGCVRSRPARNGGDVKNDKQSQVKPDDVAAVEKLEQAGFQLERHDNGTVTAVSASRQEDSTELLGELKGLPSVRSLKLTGTGITDGGLEVLKELKQLRTLDLSGAAITDKALEAATRLIQEGCAE